ncbi:uncharacterized protein si:ch73-204p21.2 [Seriola aureovittata]|uniref:uncharacterized protein si:ch73-204p21.2 n=1 Tax=Seriola aureovittata TaxID=2871759 RepID=UPI0024BE3D3D|nr:uncharacterized protein si:ch73-204p21.2 [Seriola aureovittata]
MAAVGAEVTASWFLSSGVVGFLIILLLLSIFLMALCSNCGRRSFELRDSETDKNPSALIRVVKLEDTREARENPMISEIQNDEKEFTRHEGNSFTPWRSHLGAPENNQDVQTNGSAAVMETRGNSDAAGGGGAGGGRGAGGAGGRGAGGAGGRGGGGAGGGESSPSEKSVEVVLWRSHLRASQKQDVSSSTPPDSDHVYHTIGGGQGDPHRSSPPTNQEAGGGDSVDLGDRSRNSVYAQVSRKGRQATPPDCIPEVVQVVEEEPSPPLPDRETEG